MCKLVPWAVLLRDGSSMYRHSWEQLVYTIGNAADLRGLFQCDAYV